MVDQDAGQLGQAIKACPAQGKESCETSWQLSIHLCHLMMELAVPDGVTFLHSAGMPKAAHLFSGGTV